MILVGCPIATFTMGGDHWHHWLENATAITNASREVGKDVLWHAVFHTDARGIGPFQPVIDILAHLRSEEGIQTSWSSYAVSLGDIVIDESNRYAYICFGRNLVIDRALRNQKVQWIMNMDSDISYPDDLLPRLLECEYPVVGLRCPQAGIFGPRAEPASLDNGLKIDARWHWNTAGALLVHREVFEKVPWRWRVAPEQGALAYWSDDYATCFAMEELGYPALVRHDMIAQHQPPEPDRPWGLGSYKERGYDTMVRPYV